MIYRITQDARKPLDDPEDTDGKTCDIQIKYQNNMINQMFKQIFDKQQSINQIHESIEEMNDKSWDG